MRMNWFTRHKLQSKYLFIVLMSMLLPSLLFAGCIYFLIYRLMAEQFALPEGIHTMLTPVFYKINLIIIIAWPLMFLGIFLWGLYVSHRFAGPIVRIERDLDDVLKGNWQKTIKIREKDDLGGVTSRINALIDRVRPK